MTLDKYIINKNNNFTYHSSLMQDKENLFIMQDKENLFIMQDKENLFIMEDKEKLLEL
jgi:hypothetical protein